MKLAGKTTITEDEGQIFARLSGDFNPIHLDRTVARRLQFGDTVVHGVHHMLRIWDVCARELPFLQDRTLVCLQGGFPGPVRYRDPIFYRAESLPARPGFQIVAECRGRRCLTLDVGFAGPRESNMRSGSLSTIDASVPMHGIVNQIFPPSLKAGEIPLHCDRELSRVLFPVLSRCLHPSLLAQILACTRIVGMICPGLHSIFAGLSLSVKCANRSAEGSALTFHAATRDKRFSRVAIGVNGPTLEGTLDAFFRPPPALQPSFVEVSADVPAGRYAGQRALVVGGTRGIGETTAKILAAGGADVCITYFRGLTDARALRDEILRGGGRCDLCYLDVRSASVEDFARLFRRRMPGHIYYFATPKIERQTGTNWDEDAFQHYCSYYVHPVERLFEGLAKYEGALEVGLYYPSTVFIDRPHQGFAEYAAAKKAGESLCERMIRRILKLKVEMPRLPVMKTDQTTQLLPAKAKSVKSVMLAEVDRFAK